MTNWYRLNETVDKLIKWFGTKQDTLISSVNIKTINGESVLGDGDIVVSSTVSSATNTTEGIVKLAGDLAGTANAPTVPELANKINKRQDAFYLPSNYDFTLLPTVTEKSVVVVFNHDLNGAIINLGSNKNIYFEGGSLTNGTIGGTSCQIVANKIKIFNTGVSFTGTWINDIYPEWFGDRNIVAYDWQPALQKSLDFAKLSAGKVMLSAYTYIYYNQLTVDAGVTLEGVSRGETALGAGATKGSVLWCLGNSLGSLVHDNIAIKVIGRMVNFRNFTIKGQRSLPRYGTGIEIYGVGDGVSSQALIENCSFDNIVIHGFMKGAGLRLVAGNSGAVTYCNFNNIRTRDCANHVHIRALSKNPIYNNLGSTGLPYTNINCFINSNNFSGLYMSGYCESGLYVYTEYDEDLTHAQKIFRPANNLTFNGVVLEPPYSTNSHIRLEGGGAKVKMHDIRIEALNQNVANQTVPVVFLDADTYGSTIDLDQASVTIKDLGWGNFLSSTNFKNANVSPNSENFYKNSSLVGLDKTLTDVFLPEWKIEEQSIDINNTFFWQNLQSASIVTINESTEILEEGYKVLTVVVPPQRMFRMTQNIDRVLNDIPNSRVHCKVKSANLEDVIWTYQDSVTPVLSGGTTFGGNVWEDIGGYFPITPVEIATGFYRVALFCQNYTESDITFSFTMPSFVTGKENPHKPAIPLTDIGGTIYGVLGYNTVKNIRPLTNPNHRGSSASDVILPKEGNCFEINENGFSIQKINFTTNRFRRGDIITLHFNYADIPISYGGAFIQLTRPFVSEIGGTLTLQSIDGTGLWKEISRTEKKDTGYFTGEITPLITTNFLTLDRHYNLFNLTNVDNTAIVIQRINNVIRFDEGKQITLNFNSTNLNVQIQNSAYIILALPQTYFPKDGDWIKFETNGDGTWYEIARKAVPLKPAYNGVLVVESSTSVVTNFLTLPLTGERYITLNNTSGSGVVISRINNASRFRYEPGVELFINFTTLTNTIVFNNSSYLTLKYSGTYSPTVGDWIRLITNGDGTWLELERSISNLYPLDLSLTLSATYLSGGFLTLPLKGETYFKLSAATLGGSIARINNGGTVRFGAGKIIMLEFTNITNPVTLVNSGYLILAGGINYTPLLSGGIVLYTRGDGTWRELSRF
jgi:hypothetical protein